MKNSETQKLTNSKFWSDKFENLKIRKNEKFGKWKIQQTTQKLKNSNIRKLKNSEF